MFLRALEKTARDYQVTVGYVVMPEHVHLLVSEPERENLSTVIKALKQSVARRVKRQWRRKSMQRRLFPDSVPKRFWQARFYDFNVWTAKKRIEKLRYMHRNPLIRGLVQSPEQWRWSKLPFLCLRRERSGHGECDLPAKMGQSVASRLESHTNKFVWGTQFWVKGNPRGCRSCGPPARLGQPVQHRHLGQYDREAVL
jgi:REP element-mobilizing transposase RayT